MNNTPSISFAVVQGDRIQVMKNQPTWATNPLTTTSSCLIKVNTTTPGYNLHAMALTNSPADYAVNYLGGRPIAPSTSQGTNKIFVPATGQVTTSYINDYSGTNGTAEAYAYYIEKQGGNLQTINTLTVSSNLRPFNNTGLTLNVSTGEWIEFRRNHSYWQVNPLTNVVGGHAFIRTPSGDAQGYPLWVRGITSSPADGATVYVGGNPIAPSTTAALNRIYIPQNGYIKGANIYVYSGTAGTDQIWSLYVRVNNVQDYLIASVNSSAGERVFWNQSLNIPVTTSDYIEIKGVQPSNWITNPATTIYGNYVWLQTAAAATTECPTPTPTPTPTPCPTGTLCIGNTTCAPSSGSGSNCMNSGAGSVSVEPMGSGINNPIVLSIFGLIIIAIALYVAGKGKTK